MTSNNSSDKMEKMVARIIVIREICEAKDLLFGPFSTHRTTRLKVKLWTDICDKAKSLGLVDPSKTYTYMRDTYWQNVRRHSLNKRQQAMNGKKVDRTPIDSLVYEIVDNTSALHTQPSLVGHQLYVVDASKPTLKQAALLNNTCEFNETAEEIDHLKVEPPFAQESDEQNETQETEVDEPAQNELEQPTEEPSDVKPVSVSPTDDTDFDNIRTKEEEYERSNMKKRKIQLEIDFLELQNYKTQLEVLDLETKLGIEPSKFTREIVKRKKRNNKIAFENDDDDSDVSL